MFCNDPEVIGSNPGQADSWGAVAFGSSMCLMCSLAEKENVMHIFLSLYLSLSLSFSFSVPFSKKGLLESALLHFALLNPLSVYDEIKYV